MQRQPKLISMGGVLRRVPKGDKTIRRWVKEDRFPPPLAVEGWANVWIWWDTVVEEWVAAHPELLAGIEAQVLKVEEPQTQEV